MKKEPGKSRFFFDMESRLFSQIGSTVGAAGCVNSDFRLAMYVNLVSEEELLEAVYQRGFFPRSTPFQNLPDEFIDGCLIAAWPKVMAVINEIRSKQEIPFD